MWLCSMGNETSEFSNGILWLLHEKFIHPTEFFIALLSCAAKSVKLGQSVKPKA